MREPPKSIGRLAPSAIQNSLIEQTIEFVWGCLIPWKEDSDRHHVEGEEELNAQFHNFLQTCAIENFPMVYFQHEQRQVGIRRVDLSAKPVEKVVIEGVTYTKYQPILVIEGKRLPTPSRQREREYVSGEEKLSGGIQRFKLGLHGKEHETAILLGYIQSGTPQVWHPLINNWILDLAAAHPDDWTDQEILADLENVVSEERARSVSYHARSRNCKTPEIRLLHFWILCPLRVTKSRRRKN